MAQHLVYWKTYWDDSEGGNVRSSPDWHTDSATFIETLRDGDVIWIVVTGGKTAPDDWRLLQTFVVSRVGPSPAGRGPGRFEIVGHQKGNEVYNLDAQPDLTAILWLLNFSTDTRITALGRKIGQSLQTHGYRTLAEGDISLLQEYADRLQKI